MNKATLQHKAFSADVKISADDARTVVAKISTVAVDRDGEVLISQGCNYKDYQANAVVLLLHSYYSLPVGKCVALEKQDDCVKAKIQFAERPESHPEGEEWVPDTLFSLFKQGVLNAFSVGFIPVEGRAANDRDIQKYGADARYIHSKWKLLEVSVVPLPCNQEAVATAVSKGLVTQATAEKLFKIDEKQAENEPKTPEMGMCKDCQKEYPLDDLNDDADGGYVCDDCMDDPADDERKAAPEPVQPKHVVASVALPESAPAVPVKRVHRVLAGKSAPAPDYEAVTRRLVVRQISKMRGRIYADD
jgi:HK97 family phage prohead protease